MKKINKQCLKLFMRNDVPLFIVTFLIQITFFGILFFIKGIWIAEFFYFSFLTAFVLGIYLIFRFYTSARVYKKFLLTSQNLNDYLIHEPRSHYEVNYNNLIYHFIKKEGQNAILHKNDRKLQKVLIYRFVHQMKTPISVLKLIAENHNTHEDFQMIDKNLSTIQYHLDQMLNMYKLDDFKNDFIAEKVFLNKLCKECINYLKDYFITFQVYPKLDIDEDIYVYSDPKWLKLVIHQLLTNAIKYSDKGQNVTVSVTKNNNDVLLNIIDQGMGIHETELKKVFDLFYVGENGRNNADSSGIGLYIVNTVCENLGHTVHMTSQLEKGTTVSIQF